MSVRSATAPPPSGTIRSLTFLLLLTLVMALSGCSWMTFGLWGGDDGKEIKAKGPSLGKVVDRLPELELPEVPAMKPTRDEVMAAYNRVYGMLPSASENHAVGKRLADLYMDVGQDKDIAGEGEPYAPAVTLYETLLQQQEGADNVDEILYQLARAHDLSGNGERTLAYLNRLIAEHPDSEFMPEAHFRRAELKFSADDYRAAAADYSYVVELGDSTPYYRNSAYMLGWAEFKRSRFDEGLHQFFNVLDSLLVEGDSVTAATDSAAALSGVDRELLEDSFRVVTLALSYLDGAQTLADEMRRRDKPHWQYLAYQRLADDYFAKERFLDTVQTWQTFVEHNSLDPRAPAAHQGMIKTLIDAGFPSDVVPKKKEYVARYGVYSEFWSH
ncbi:MAG: tetratricopeptide repeat protein, partial [Pseudomonadota bacterium]